MWKPVQLQGWGEGSTTINALKAPAEKLQTWRDFVDGLIASDDIDLLPGQEVGPGTPEPVTLWTEEGAGVLVLAKASGNQAFGYVGTTTTSGTTGMPVSTASPSRAPTPAAASSPTDTPTTCRSPTTASPTTPASTAAAFGSDIRY